MTRNIYSLSLPQRDIYFDQLLYAGSAIYNIGAKVEVIGTLDPEVFNKAAQQLVAQHDSLRSVIITIDGNPFVQVLDAMETKVIYRDFSGTQDPVSMADTYVQQEFCKPFDLDGKELLNCYYLVKVAEQLFYIVGKYHHLIADGWSTSLLFTRLGNNYTSIRCTQNNEQVTYPYTDFIQDDLDYISSEEYVADQLYWKDKFSSVPAPGLLKNNKSIESRRKEIYINRKLYDQIAAFSSANTVSVFHFLLGVVYQYFSSLFDDDTFVIGLPLLNRKNKKFKQTIGLFAGITPLLFSDVRNRRFTELLKMIRDELRESFRHQRLPLSTIISNAGWSRQSPAYQIFFSYEKHDYAVTFDGYEATVLPLTHQLERAPLAIYIREFDNIRDVKIDFDYNTGYFDTALINTCVDQFLSIIPALLENPEIDIELLGAEEKNRILNDFNNTAAAYPLEQTVMDLFNAQVLRTPLAPAVVFNDDTLSYIELQHASNRLAAYLQGVHGIINEDLVGIMSDRSLHMLTGILGILKSGAAYVPVDPDHPASRISYILEQSKVKVVVTIPRYREWLEESGFTAIVPDDWSTYDDEVQPLSGVGLAYVMYTSGSTGRPKGVEVTHRAVSNFLQSMRSRLEPAEGDRLLAVTTYSFDISVLELLLPLISGSTVVIAAGEHIKDALLLRKRIMDDPPDFMQCTPGMWQMLLDAGWKGNQRMVALCGGERLSEELSRQLLQEVKHCWNMYGPTETTIWSSMQLISQPSDAASIGRPICNTQMYILNARLQVLPTGISGDIYIGGEGLARGYKDQPSLTAERFISHELGRLYRTGDIGKWSSDGRILFGGRADDQVKIRGYRVEPGEIEHVLLGHAAVSKAVVIAEGNNYLVAYIVLSEAVDIPVLRDHLRSVLPEYMVPGYFIVLDQLPLNANGKIDRKQLPAVSELPETDYTAPSTFEEAVLVRIWEDVLSRERVGVKDNFFEIGGHSLRAIRILSRMHKELGVELGLHELFSFPRLDDLARLISRRNKSGIYEGIGPIAESDYYEVSHAQRRLWILSRFPEGSLAYNIAEAFRISGPLDTESFRSALQTVIARHESLRTIFITVNEVPVQKVLSAEVFSFNLQEIDLRGCEEQVAILAQQELETAFDLLHGPLIRGRLLRTGEAEYVFLLTLHHIITDGWSMEVIVKELLELYDAYRLDRPSGLRELRLQYRDYAHWQNEQLRSEKMAVHRQYWIDQLSGNIPQLELPLDYRRPAVLNYHGGRVSNTINNDTYDQLRQLAGMYEASMYTLLMAFSKILLYRYTGQTDIIVGYPVSMRNYFELEDQVGFYLNTLALRTTINGKNSFREVVMNIKEGMISGSQHQIYPFDKIVSNLGLIRDPGRSPLFDVVVVLQNLDIHKSEINKLGDLRVEIYQTDKVTSAVDLRLEFIERADYITMNFDYNLDLFKSSSIRLFMDRFIILLNQVLADPDINVEDIIFEKEEHITTATTSGSHFTINF